MPLRSYRAPTPGSHRPVAPLLRPQRGPATVPRPLRKTLEGMVDVPAVTLMGLVLKASSAPQALAAQWMDRAEKAVKQLLEDTTEVTTA